MEEEDKTQTAETPAAEKDEALLSPAPADEMPTLGMVFAADNARAGDGASDSGATAASADNAPDGVAARSAAEDKTPFASVFADSGTMPASADDADGAHGAAFAASADGSASALAHAQNAASPKDAGAAPESAPSAETLPASRKKRGKSKKQARQAKLFTGVGSVIDADALSAAAAGTGAAASDNRESPPTAASFSRRVADENAASFSSDRAVLSRDSAHLNDRAAFSSNGRNHNGDAASSAAVLSRAGIASAAPVSAFGLFFAVVAAGVLMMLSALAVFFLYVKAPEQVMVPDIEGKQLTTALLEMQAKELYPKLQLRYTDSPDDAGKVLSQNPIAGAIVKAGTRVTLTVSRGVIIDQVENYVGQKLDDVKIKLQTMFTGSARPLIVLANPVYKANQAEEGTILEQNPPEGTEISAPVTVQLVVSRGPAYDYTAVPNLVGLSVRELLARVAQNKLVFDFSSHVATGDEKAGTVTGQQTFSREFVSNYTRMNVELALPEAAQNGLLYGIFQYKATAYPYAVEMKLDAIPETGDRYNIVTFMHTGGTVTMPYAVPKNTELILTIEGREYKRELVD